LSASIAERLRAGSMLGAEGYVFELYIKAGPFVPEVVLDFPDAVRELHREFLRAGADVMVALTYYAHREKLRDVGREGDLEAMNRQAVRIAGGRLGDQEAEPSQALAGGEGLARGLLERRRDDRDARVVRLHPTAAAIERRNRHEEVWGAELALRLEQLAPAEREAVLAAAPGLRALVTRLR